jgi:putative MATE family efflux protein
MLFTKRDLGRLVWPLIGEQILSVTVGMADTVMVAYCGEAAMSGVALSDSISFLLLQVFAALCTGGAVVVSQHLGRGDGESAGRAAGQLVWLTGGVALVMGGAGLIFRVPLLHGIFGGVEQAVMDQALAYFTVISFSFPFLGVYNAGAALLRSIGATNVSLWIALLMNGINVAGNALLIYGWGMGAAGAALASLVARAVAAVAILAFLWHRHTPFSLRRGLFCPPQARTVAAILRIGVPSGIENGMFQIGKLLVQRLVASFGTVAIAANAAAGNIACIATIPGSAISLALLSVVGRCMGARNPDEAALDTKRLLKAAFLSMLALNVGVWLLLGPIVGLYNLSGPTREATVQLMHWHCVFAALLWTPSFCLPSALRGAGDVSFTMKVSIASMWAFRIGGSYVLAQGLGLGVLGVWMAIFLDWGFRAILFFIRFKQGKWRTREVLR